MAAGKALTDDSSPLFGRRWNPAWHRPTSSTAQDFSEADVNAVLRVIPSQGWVGRRDRALVVLSHCAGLPYESIAELTVGDVTVRDGVAVITTPGGRTTLRQDDDVLVCGPCALARWLHALDMTTVYGSSRVSTAVIARAAPLHSQSPHLCQGTVSVTESSRRMTLLPSIDQYGPLTDSHPPAVGSPRPARTTAGRIPGQRAADVRQLTVAHRPSHAVTDLDAWSGRFDGQARGLERRAKYLLEDRSGQTDDH
jgi:hypothetical protein